MSKQITITTSDQVQLYGYLHEAQQSVKGAILLNPGLGIPKEFYQNYATILADHGYHCLVYDYRGIQASGKAMNDQSRINLRNWGLIDMVDCIDFLHRRYPTLKLYFFGHSIGGQVAGLIKNHSLIERFIFIATTGGYWPLFNFPLNIFSAFMWYLHIPITSRLFGYMPPSLTYRGIRMAKGVALEWAAWSRQKNYIAAFFNKTITNQYYQKITQQIDAIWFTDDQIAIPKTVESILAYYPNATITRHPQDPKALGLKRVGHSGFFNKKLGQAYWNLPLEIIENS